MGPTPHRAATMGAAFDSIFFWSLIRFHATLCRDDLAAHNSPHLAAGAVAHHAYGRLLRPSVALASRLNLNCYQVDRSKCSFACRHGFHLRVGLRNFSLRDPPACIALRSALL